MLLVVVTQYNVTLVEQQHLVLDHLSLRMWEGRGERESKRERKRERAEMTIDGCVVSVKWPWLAKEREGREADSDSRRRRGGNDRPGNDPRNPGSVPGKSFRCSIRVPQKATLLLRAAVSAHPLVYGAEDQPTGEGERERERERERGERKLQTHGRRGEWGGWSKTRGEERQRIYM